MFIRSVTKNFYTKFLKPQINSSDNNKKVISNNEKEKKTFWESIQKLKPLVK